MTTRRALRLGKRLPTALPLARVSRLSAVVVGTLPAPSKQFRRTGPAQKCESASSAVPSALHDPSYGNSAARARPAPTVGRQRRVLLRGVPIPSIEPRRLLQRMMVATRRWQRRASTDDTAAAGAGKCPRRRRRWPLPRDVHTPANSARYGTCIDERAIAPRSRQWAAAVRASQLVVREPA